ncbi:MAG: S-methyl-5'-thioadenosine phosphorylase [Patescibacteria group bacterium]
MIGKAEIGIIGGSGFYGLAEDLREIELKTPFGWPSDKIALGKTAGREVAFLPRHGKRHQFPPHKIPYKANLWALKKLGVERVLSVTACGSLQKEIKRGDFVVLDQFVDRTRRTDISFYDGPETVHISTAYPFCPELSKIAYETGKKLKIKIHPKGTLVVIEGPRFSTRAESEWFTKMGWDAINMTGYPEVALARELELCYSSIALVTDYDVGIVAREKLAPVSTEEVIKVFGENIGKAKKLVEEMVGRIPKERECECKNALVGSRVG